MATDIVLTGTVLYARDDLHAQRLIAERLSNEALFRAAMLVRNSASPDAVASAVRDAMFADKLVAVLRLAHGKTADMMVDGEPLTEPWSAGWSTTKQVAHRFGCCEQHVRNRINVRDRNPEAEVGLIGRMSKRTFWKRRGQA